MSGEVEKLARETVHGCEATKRFQQLGRMKHIDHARSCI